MKFLYFAEIELPFGQKEYAAVYDSVTVPNGRVRPDQWKQAYIEAQTDARKEFLLQNQCHFRSLYERGVYCTVSFSADNVDNFTSLFDDLDFNVFDQTTNQLVCKGRKRK